jgi:hypothetical protein
MSKLNEVFSRHIADVSPRAQLEKALLAASAPPTGDFNLETRDDTSESR